MTPTEAILIGTAFLLVETAAFAGLALILLPGGNA